MFIEYELTIYAKKEVIDSLKFRAYDDYSAIAKANKYFNFGVFERISLDRKGKRVKMLTK